MPHITLMQVVTLLRFRDVADYDAATEGDEREAAREEVCESVRAHARAEVSRGELCPTTDRQLRASPRHRIVIFASRCGTDMRINMCRHVYRHACMCTGTSKDMCTSVCADTPTD